MVQGSQSGRTARDTEYGALSTVGRTLAVLPYGVPVADLPLGLGVLSAAVRQSSAPHSGLGGV